MPSSDSSINDEGMSGVPSREGYPQPGWFERLFRSPNSAEDPSTTVTSLEYSILQGYPAEVLIGKLFENQQADERKLIRQKALLEEALNLLDEADRRVIGVRISTPGEDAFAERVGGSPLEARARFEAAVGLLYERLAWVTSRECRGMSPPERAAMGRVRFFKELAQDVATQLRLPLEVVEHWISEGDQEP